MDTTPTLNTPKIIENLNLSNRKNLKLEGIVEIKSSSENFLLVKLKDTSLSISGQNMHITRLDVSLGLLDIEGEIDCIKYGKKTNFFKRLFKWKFHMF